MDQSERHTNACAWQHVPRWIVSHSPLSPAKRVDMYFLFQLTCVKHVSVAQKAVAQRHLRGKLNSNVSVQP